MTHGSAHHVPAFDADWAQRLDELTGEAELGRLWVTEAARWISGLLDSTTVRTALDVGAGPGVFTTELARAFPDASVTAVDGEDVLLEHARALATGSGLAARVTTRRMDLAGDLKVLPSADLIWISRVLHHLPDQPRALRQLASRLTPAGAVAVVEGGLPTRFLPDGHPAVPGARPGLFARLESVTTYTVAGLIATERPPVSDWPAALRAAGLSDVRAKTFLLDIPAPVDSTVRRYAHRQLTMVRRLADRGLEADDRAVLDRLLDDTEFGVSHRPDLFLLGGFTVYFGRRNH
jgi:SAM-dependent methyltransferase